MGTQPPWFFFQKDVSSTFVSISFVFFLPVEIILPGIFGTYGVFRTEKTHSICIFSSLKFFRFEKSSSIGEWQILRFSSRKIALHGDSATVVLFLKKKCLPHLFQYHSYSFCLLKLYCTAFPAPMEFFVLKKLILYAYFLP